jgi:hypothetical protein
MASTRSLRSQNKQNFEVEEKIIEKNETSVAAAIKPSIRYFLNQKFILETV